jgi:hypothetical protein
VFVAVAISGIGVISVVGFVVFSAPSVMQRSPDKAEFQ